MHVSGACVSLCCVSAGLHSRASPLATATSAHTRSGQPLLAGAVQQPHPSHPHPAALTAREWSMGELNDPNTRCRDVFTAQTARRAGCFVS